MTSTTIGHDAVARETGHKRRFEAAPSPRARRRVPIPPLIALAGVALVGLLAISPVAPQDTARPIVQRNLRVSTQADGSLVIRNLADGVVVGRAPGGGESFVRGVFHALIGYRHLHGVGQDVPYRLAELSNGRVVLTDPKTSSTIDLEGFGPTNASKFTAMLGLPPFKAAK